LALCIAAILPTWIFWGLGALSSERTVIDIHREFAFEEEEWSVTRVNPYKRPSLGNLTPSFDYRVDGGDRPAILMPPPCELSFTIGKEDADCHFQTTVGIGRDALAPQGRGNPAWREGLSSIQIRFEVEIDGESVYDEVLTYTRDAVDQSDRIWHSFGQDEELPVEPGQVLTLRTSWVSPTFQTDIRTPIAICGFGSPQLVRRQDLPRAVSSPETPNIILIVMDTLRADRMSCYGYPKPTTPHLDALAANGLLYEEARATSSWTWPSTASILTGLESETHGVVSDGRCYLDARLECISEVLERRGYTTIAFTCNPLIVPNKNFHQGFERFDSFPMFRKTDVVLETIRNFMARARGTRFFLYLHLVDPHDQYELTTAARERVGHGTNAPMGIPPQGLRGLRPAILQGLWHDSEGLSIAEQFLSAEALSWLNTSYDAAVATADDYVGAILNQLELLELTDETIIVFTSDHGEEFFEHGHLAHGQSLHPELVRVPLILSGPGIPAGVRTKALVSNRHIAPTLAKFGGAELADVRDPLDLSEPESAQASPFVITSTHQGWWNGQNRVRIYGITTEEWALHWAPRGAAWREEPEPDSPGAWRLYHRSTDPGELTDVAAQHPDVAARLLEQLQRSLVEASARSSGVSLGVGEAGAEMLRGIGYTAEYESQGK
jgi:arylsulfatase A-like enzyme